MTTLSGALAASSIRRFNASAESSFGVLAEMTARLGAKLTLDQSYRPRFSPPGYTGRLIAIYRIPREIAGTGSPHRMFNSAQSPRPTPPPEILRAAQDWAHPGAVIAFALAAAAAVFGDDALGDYRLSTTVALLGMSACMGRPFPWRIPPPLPGCAVGTDHPSRGR